MFKPAIHIEQLTSRYGSRTVLDKLSLSIAPNTLTGLLGPNGAGKSTLLKSISGLLQAQSGHITLHGFDIQTLSKQELAQHIASVPQEMDFSFPFTTLEIVLMGRHPYHAGSLFESEQDINIALSALKQCHAEEFADRNIQTLSAGERQRVIFARALAQQAKIILLDEPTSNLDIRYEWELYELARARVNSNKCTILTVMHDINTAIEFCDEIAFVKNGKIVAAGGIDEVIEQSLISDIYQTNVSLCTNPVSGKPLILPERRKS